ncbi:MAG: AAA family ATPase, partial [Saprospiraceae bacterium]|nr:AAA family ATPase [Saprospiraceae bacterium]
MHISKLELINFKRFTHLMLEDIPADTRLVLLIGANGSGKSSVFDAFELLNKVTKGEDASQQWVDYYRKQAKQDFRIVIDQGLGDMEIIGKDPTRDLLRGV